jgi:hypothetical protein
VIVLIIRVAYFKKDMVFEIKSAVFIAYFKNDLFSEINCFIKPVRAEA